MNITVLYLPPNEFLAMPLKFTHKFTFGDCPNMELLRKSRPVKHKTSMNVCKYSTVLYSKSQLSQDGWASCEYCVASYHLQFSGVAAAHACYNGVFVIKKFIITKV